MLIGGLVGNYIYKQKEKVKQYCGKKFKYGSSIYNQCIDAGGKIITQKVETAKKKVAARKSSKK